MSRACVAVLVVSLLLVAVLPGLAQQTSSANDAAIPTLVNFSGVLTDLEGKPLTGIVGVTFLLYKDQQGGAPLWMETQNIQPNKTGQYSVMLGATTADGLPSDLFVSGEARWLGVQVQGQEEQTRVMLLSVPYAMKAADAQTLGGLPASAFVLATPVMGSNTSAPQASSSAITNASAPPTSSDVTTTDGTVNALPLWTTATNIQNSIVTQTGTTAVNIAGKLNLPATGTATSTGGKNSEAHTFAASAYNSSTSAAVAQTFQLQAEPAGNDTSAPSGTLNMLFGSGTSTPAETGLKISNRGLITFATGQTFPGTGDGTITGITTASGSGLSGGGTSGALSLTIPSAGVTNTMLQNSSLTITAGSGLSGGGKTSLGGTSTLSIPSAGVTNSMLANPSLTLNANSAGGLTTPGAMSLGSTNTIGLKPCSANQVLEYSGSAWNCAAAATGTITGVTAGSGLSGGGTSGSVTLTNSGVLGLAAGSGISVGSGQTPTVANTGVLSLTAGTGISSTGGQSPTLTINPSVVPELGTANTFTGNQTVNGSVTASSLTTGAISGTTLYVVGNKNPTTTVQGAYVAWNVLTGGTGETDFINNEGLGGGAFAFMNTPNSGSPRSTLMFIDGTGEIGIGTTAPANQLDVHAQSDVNAINAVGFNAPSGSGLDGGGSVYGTGGTDDPTGCLFCLVGGPGVSAVGGADVSGMGGGGTGVQGYGGVGATYDGNGGTFQGGDSSAFGDGVNGVAGSGNAGSFIGDVEVTGTLSKAGGSFKIDHPLDPANKYLYHSFVESPDMMNIYNGNVVTDSSGLATVTLPDWFETLNKDYRYQLTVIGQFAQAIVAKKIENNEFQIRTSLPDVEVSWQITGIRQDPWANAHRIPVEQEKEARLKGFYIHSELYGAPPEKQIEWARHPQMMKKMKETRARQSAAAQKQAAPRN
jgi:trimeric autotransporter adhesin